MIDLPPLDYRDLDGERVQLLEDFTFLGIRVPSGFVCDGQSWGIGEKKAARAAFLHDWLYFNTGKLPGVEKEYSRAEADALFRKALILTGVRRARAWTRWAGLRLAGWKAWNAHEKRWKKATLGLLLALCASILTGCAYGAITRNLSKDGAIVTLTSETIYGRNKVTRIGGTTNSVTVLPDGTVHVNQPK